jgi:hypothetical protein
MNHHHFFGGQARRNQNLPNPRANGNDFLSAMVFPWMFGDNIGASVDNERAATEQGEAMGMGGMGGHKVDGGVDQPEEIAWVIVGIECQIGQA